MKNIVEQPFQQDKIKQLEARVAELEALVKYYEEQIRLAKQRQFASSSEKTVDGGEQLGMFDEVENTADAKAEEKVTFEEISYTRKKKSPKASARTMFRSSSSRSSSMSFRKTSACARTAEVHCIRCPWSSAARLK